MERLTTFLAVAAGIVICVILIILVVNVINNIGTGENSGDSGQNSPIQTGEASSPESSAATQPSEEPEKVTYVPMPEVRGKTVEEVRNALKNLGVKSEVEYEQSDSLEAGIVISADVAEGADVAVGSTVTLKASSGPRDDIVPSVTGMTYEEANNLLLDSGFKVAKLEAYSETVEAGYVALQTPAENSNVAKGSEITLTVSLGREGAKTRVPNLLGRTEMDGIVIANEARVQIGTVTYEHNPYYPADQICYQSYSADLEVDVDTVIQITVSLGPETATPVLYRCNTNIAAPTLEEAPDYVTNSSVTLKLVADDGTVVLETITSSFPYATNHNNLTSSGGTLTVTYTVTKDSTVDESGTVIPGGTETKSFTRRIEFTPQ